MEKKNLIILGVIIILIIAAAVTKLAQPTDSPIAEQPLTGLPKELPALQPLPEPMRGEQVYNITGPEDQRFRISQVIINPLDVAIGGIQTITVTVEDLDKSDITEESRVTAIALTDSHSAEFSLKIAEITDQEQALVVIWQGFWELEDSYNQNYRLTVEAFKEAADDSVTIAFR